MMSMNTSLKNQPFFSLFSLEISRKILGFASPIIMSMMISMAAGFVAMLIVARLGDLELAAGALAISTFIPILTVSTTIFYSLSILISHYKGENKAAEDIGHLIKNAFWLAAIIAVPINILLQNIDKVLVLFKQDPKLIQLTKGYFFYAAFTMIPNLFGVVIMQFYTGIGKPRFSFIIASITLLPTILLSYILILGKFGFPVMGLAGISASSFIIGCLIVISILIYMYFHHDLQDFKIFSGRFLPDFQLSKKIFLLGLPIGIQFGTELAAIAVATYFMGYLGVIALAASQISSQYTILLVMIFLGIAQAVSIFVSEALAKKHNAAIKQYVVNAMLLLVVMFFIIIVLFVFFPKDFIGLYVNTNDPKNFPLVQLTSYLLIITGFLLLVDGLRNILSATLRGLHDSATPMRIGTICLWFVSLPVAYLAGLTLNGGPIWLRIGFISGFLLAVILLWRKLAKKLLSLD